MNASLNAQRREYERRGFFFEYDRRSRCWYAMDFYTTRSMTVAAHLNEAEMSYAVAKLSVARDHWVYAMNESNQNAAVRYVEAALADELRKRGVR